MQPTKLKPEEIKNITDWLFNEIGATQQMEVKNILSTPYHFRYCTGEEIETPDEMTRSVVRRHYDERDFAPGDQVILLGAAARLFVEEVARQYLYETTYKATKEEKEKAAAQALLDLPRMIEAAKKVIIGEPEMVSRANRPAPQASQPSKPASQPKSSSTADDGEYRKIALQGGGFRYLKGDMVVSQAEYEANTKADS